MPRQHAWPAGGQRGHLLLPGRELRRLRRRGLGKRLYAQIGDNAVGILLANLLAQAVLDRLHRPTTGKPAQLEIDCLSGAWTNSLLERGPQAQLRLSPGDLDEAVTTLLVFGRSADNNGASSFERIDAYRKAVIGGISACRL